MKRRALLSGLAALTAYAHLPRRAQGQMLYLKHKAGGGGGLTVAQTVSTVFNTNADKTTPSMNVQTNDLLIVAAVGESDAVIPFTVSGGGLTWTQRVGFAGGTGQYCGVALWGATATATTSMTATITDSSGAAVYGATAFVMRGASGSGASAQGNTTSSAPNVNLTTTAANSAIVVVVGDWNAVDGATRTWRANAGTLTEYTYFRDAASYTVYMGVHVNAGAIGTYAVGLTQPATMQYMLCALEVLAT